MCFFVEIILSFFFYSSLNFYEEIDFMYILFTHSTFPSGFKTTFHSPFNNLSSSYKIIHKHTHVSHRNIKKYYPLAGRLVTLLLFRNVFSLSVFSFNFFVFLLGSFSLVFLWVKLCRLFDLFDLLLFNRL